MNSVKNALMTMIILLSILSADAAIVNKSPEKINNEEIISKSPNKLNFSDKKLNVVFTNYFLLKDELVSTNGPSAAAKAKLLVAALTNVKMKELSNEVHTVWMKVMKNVTADSKAIAGTSDIKTQRIHFTSLSKKMYDLMKVAKFESPVYYQFCPMANDGKGAHWLSKEKAIKNPYYGSKMLKCGEVVETIK
ncbi:MAG: DUF3347 domain-containing protein [Flavobacterium micromati]|nr:DUF3347 domain-containing protein [Flavobacterium micromati]